MATPDSPAWAKEHWEFLGTLAGLLIVGCGLWFGLTNKVDDVADANHRVEDAIEKIVQVQTQQTKDVTAIREQQIRAEGETKTLAAEMRGTIDRIKDAVDRLNSDTGMR